MAGVLQAGAQLGGVATGHDQERAVVLVEREGVRQIVGAPLVALERGHLVAIGHGQTLLDLRLVAQRQVGLADPQPLAQEHLDDHWP
jgi:hypothetical protein